MKIENNNELKNEMSAMREEMKELLDKNISLSEDLLVLTKKINHYVVWERIFGVLKIFIFVIPLILSMIYLPTILKNAFAPYKELLGESKDFNSNLLNIDIGEYLK